MKERNDYTYKFFTEKYKKALDKCNKLTKYKAIEDTLKIEDK